MSTRGILRRNAYQFLQDYKAVDSSLLAVHRARPGGAGPTPCAYVGQVRETFLHTGQLRQGTHEVDLVIKGAPLDSDPDSERLDDIADGMVEMATDLPHLFGSNTVQEPVRVTTVSLVEGETGYDGIVVTLGRITFLEGRA